MKNSAKGIIKKPSQETKIIKSLVGFDRKVVCEIAFYVIQEIQEKNGASIRFSRQINHGKSGQKLIECIAHFSFSKIMNYLKNSISCHISTCP